MWRLFGSPLQRRQSARSKSISRGDEYTTSLVLSYPWCHLPNAKLLLCGHDSIRLVLRLTVEQGAEGCGTPLWGTCWSWILFRENVSIRPAQHCFHYHLHPCWERVDKTNIRNSCSTLHGVGTSASDAFIMHPARGFSVLTTQMDICKTDRLWQLTEKKLMNIFFHSIHSSLQFESIFVQPIEFLDKDEAEETLIDSLVSSKTFL